MQSTLTVYKLAWALEVLAPTAAGAVCNWITCPSLLLLAASTPPLPGATFFWKRLALTMPSAHGTDLSESSMATWARHAYWDEHALQTRPPGVCGLQMPAIAPKNPESAAAAGTGLFSLPSSLSAAPATIMLHAVLI